jgi:hypothetical protein
LGLRRGCFGWEARGLRHGWAWLGAWKDAATGGERVLLDDFWQKLAKTMKVKAPAMKAKLKTMKVLRSTMKARFPTMKVSKSTMKAGVVTMKVR